jgi:hypothetical protein
VPHFYHYARDIAFLDFASLTGHDLFLAKPGWDQIRAETAKANRPGFFVAFMGYEWTQTYDKGGHHNVFFKEDKGRYVQFREAPRPDQLYQRLREVDDPDNVLIIPHAHEAGDWHYTDAQMQRLVEIYSGHGSFEYFGQRFLKRGYRMGVVGASDDHSGHPGYAPAPGRDARRSGRRLFARARSRWHLERSEIPGYVRDQRQASCRENDHWGQDGG